VRRARFNRKKNNHPCVGPRRAPDFSGGAEQRKKSVDSSSISLASFDLSHWDDSKRSERRDSAEDSCTPPVIAFVS
jgi:hypothetical protein